MDISNKNIKIEIQQILEDKFLDFKEKVIRSISILLNNYLDRDIRERMSIIRDNMLLLLSSPEVNKIIYSENYLKNFKYDCDRLINIVKFYLKGDLSRAYTSFTLWFNKKDFFNHGKKSYQQNFFYRCRYKDSNVRKFTKDEMSHIPFELRNKVQNERYSIDGLPALYMGSSTYICWEELNRKPLSDLYFVCIHPIKEIHLFDMRIYQENKCINKFDFSWRQRLPLLLYCAMASPQREGFKEEYIIPQILMQILMSKKYKDGNIDGVIYNSLKVDENKDFIKTDSSYFNLADNIVLPTRSGFKKGHCEYINNLVEFSQPQSFDELIIKKVYLHYYDRNNNGYSNTLFHEFEEKLRENFENKSGSSKSLWVDEIPKVCTI